MVVMFLAAFAVVDWNVLRCFAGTAQAVPNLIAGSEFDYTAARGDSLVSISARYGISEALLRQSNSLSANARLRRGQILHLDNRHLVPKPLSDGIIINIPQRMLFYFEHGALVAYYPVSLGRRSWRTPVGTFKVIGKREHPTWVVPPSIQEEMAENGDEVKTEVPPGPDNPLGDYALDLSITGYRIHGTIAPLSIYAFRTHGCIRLHPADIEDLYRRVSIGTPGEIIYTPMMLAASDDGRVFLEVDRDIYHRMPNTIEALRGMAEVRNISNQVDWEEAEQVLQDSEGIAREVAIHNP
ncbi:MAG TPA: L,D-transpeptidase family protein [Candidatus Binataceae bacterium]|nr:L,D-transpeptidase family protein [Candidatus Binataceae bacterium]